MRRWAIAARTQRGRSARYGARAAAYSRWRALRNAVRPTIASQRDAADDVADRDELRGAGEDEDAHRARLERREAGLAGAQPVDEPEAARGDHDPERVEEELPPRRREVHRAAAIAEP